MGKYSLIYYPTVSIPKEWGKTALINGYSIGSVFPENWVEWSYSNELDPSMNELRVEKTPEKYFSKDEIKLLDNNKLFKPFTSDERYYLSEKINEEFKKIITSEEFNIEEKAKDFTSDVDGRIHRSWISKGKIKSSLIDELVELGVADPKEYTHKNQTYFIADNSVAALYISLLTDVIAYSNPNSISASDQLNNWQNAVNPWYSNKKQLCINLFLDNCIISPKSDTPIETIINFLDNHKDLARQYNEGIIKLSYDIALDANESDISDIIRDKVDIIQNELRVFEESLTDLRIKYEHKMAILVFPLMASLLTQNIFNLGIGVSCALKYYNNYLSELKEIRKKPWTYIYELREKNII